MEVGVIAQLSLIGAIGFFGISLLIFDIATTWRQTKAQERSADAAERGNQIQQNVAQGQSQLTEQVKDIAGNTKHFSQSLKQSLPQQRHII